MTHGLPDVFVDAHRCVFESNFPVDGAHCTLPVLAAAYARALPARCARGSQRRVPH